VLLVIGRRQSQPSPRAQTRHPHCHCHHHRSHSTPPAPLLFPGSSPRLSSEPRFAGNHYQLDPLKLRKYKQNLGIKKRESAMQKKRKKNSNAVNIMHFSFFSWQSIFKFVKMPIPPVAV
jgi:hypothetical protein